MLNPAKLTLCPTETYLQVNIYGPNQSNVNVTTLIYQMCVVYQAVVDVKYQCYVTTLVYISTALAKGMLTVTLR